MKVVYPEGNPNVLYGTKNANSGPVEDDGTQALKDFTRDGQHFFLNGKPIHELVADEGSQYDSVNQLEELFLNYMLDHIDNEKTKETLLSDCLRHIHQGGLAYAANNFYFERATQYWRENEDKVGAVNITSPRKRKFTFTPMEDPYGISINSEIGYDVKLIAKEYGDIDQLELDEGYYVKITSQTTLTTDGPFLGKVTVDVQDPDFVHIIFKDFLEKVDGLKSSLTEQHASEATEETYDRFAKLRDAIESNQFENVEQIIHAIYPFISSEVGESVEFAEEGEGSFWEYVIEELAPYTETYYNLDREELYQTIQEEKQSYYSDEKNANRLQIQAQQFMEDLIELRNSGLKKKILNIQDSKLEFFESSLKNLKEENLSPHEVKLTIGDVVSESIKHQRKGRFEPKQTQSEKQLAELLEKPEFYDLANFLGFEGSVKELANIPMRDRAAGVFEEKQKQFKHDLGELRGQDDEMKEEVQIQTRQRR